jgi:hypothetical protein
MGEFAGGKISDAELLAAAKMDKSILTVGTFDDDDRRTSCGVLRR